MRVLLTTHVQPIPGYAHRPHDLKFTSIPLAWFYEDVDDPRRGINFADEYPPDIPEPAEPPAVTDAYGKTVLADGAGGVLAARRPERGRSRNGSGLGSCRLGAASSGRRLGRNRRRPVGTGAERLPGFDADNRAVELLNTGPFPYVPAEYGSHLVTDRPVDLSGTGDFSIEMWFKHVGDLVGSSSTAEDFVTNADLGYASDMYLFELAGSGSPGFLPVSIRYKTEFSGEATDFSVSVPEDLDWNAWHYLVFTKERSLGCVYLDGVLLGTGAVNGDVTSTAETLGFGQDRNFKGFLDEIALQLRLDRGRRSRTLCEGNGRVHSWRCERGWHG